MKKQLFSIFCVAFLGALQVYTAKGAQNVVKSDINQQDFFGNTLLYEAARDGRLKEVKKLLDEGADPNIANRDGETPLDVAIQKGIGKTRTDIVELLLSNGANPDIQDRASMTPLMWAYYWNEQGAIKALLKAGANPNLINNEGWTAEQIGKYKGRFQQSTPFKD